MARRLTRPEIEHDFSEADEEEDVLIWRALRWFLLSNSNWVTSPQLDFQVIKLWSSAKVVYMAQIPKLDNAPLNLKYMREQSQKELINILKNIEGNKCLVIDPKLSGSISLIIENAVLREHVDELRHLSAETIQTECSKVIFLVRSQLSLMKNISAQIHNDISKGLEREYYLYFVPCRTVACELILEEEKVHHLLRIGEYVLYIVPLDEDVLSFEHDYCLKECLVDGDMSSLWHIAKAIHKLEFLSGVIPNVMAKGNAAVRVAEILNRMQAEEPVSSLDMVVPEISSVILLDREVDMVTPMCTQLTYEGMVDEFLRVNNGSVEVMDVKQEGKKMKIPLNSSDKLFNEVRDLHFEVAAPILRQKGMSMQQDYNEVKSNREDVSLLKDFVKNLHSCPEVKWHLKLINHLKPFVLKNQSFRLLLDIEQTLVEAEGFDICLDYIEEMMLKKKPLANVLRLLILFSVTNSGLPEKHFDRLRYELLLSYGFGRRVTLKNLEKAGLFKKQETKGNWLRVKRALKLVVEGTDTANPNDIDNVFSGYAPLSIRLVQHAIRSGWHPIEGILKLLPGPHSETKRGPFSSSTSFENFQGAATNTDNVADEKRSLVLVIFIGGVTFAEISTLRFLTSQEGMAYDFIVGTTKVVSGNSLAETFMGKMEDLKSFMSYFWSFFCLL